ncbi:MAG TPA: hypothetical protein VF619_11350 [Allosphingosinicella sp.]|jgi:hypothetical protein
MISAALLLALVPPIPGLPPAASVSRPEEERLAAVGYSPAALKIIREAPAVAERDFDKEFADYFLLRKKVDEGTLSAEQLQQDLDAKLHKRRLEWARRDDAILRRLPREDRLLYLEQMRRPVPPRPLLWPAPPPVDPTQEQVAAFRKERLDRMANDEAQWRRLSGQERLDFLIRLSSLPR